MALLFGEMPMMADIEDPPRSRAKGLLAAFAVTIPLTCLLAAWALPALWTAVVGNSEAFDARLRAEDGYLNAVCTQAIDRGRDQHLCGCVLAAEVPSLDCRPHFLRWSLLRQAVACEDPVVSEEALAFCACVSEVHGQWSAAERGSPEARKLSQRYGNCAELPDAFPLPTLEELAPGPS